MNQDSIREGNVEDMYCFQCKDPITPENDGVCINEGTPHQMFQCNDCHYIEFGYNLPGTLLYWYNSQQVNQ